MYTIRDGYDRKKHPRMLKVRPMTFEEALKLKRGDECLFHANDGSARRVRVSGQLKTWKTRPGDLSFPVKYGMWESAKVEWKDGVHRGTQLLVEACGYPNDKPCPSCRQYDTTGGLVTECIPCGFYRIDGSTS